jgi:tRNA(Ile)-lysidine synthase
MTPKDPALGLTGGGNRFSVRVMPTQKAAAAVSVSEARSLFDDFKASKALVLAVSGGPDSTALMLLAARWAKARKKGPKLVAVTVDHGLRPEAAREAAAVKRLARELGIEHRTLHWTGNKPKTGLQEAAREARYRLLNEAARKAGAPYILTAHTLDDQAETVLIRLTRGSGLTGLAAMQRISAMPLAPAHLSPRGRGRTRHKRVYARLQRAMARSGEGGPTAKSLPPLPPGEREHVVLRRVGGDQLLIARPLLDIPKARLIATLEAAKIPFAEDPSNRDPRFTRVRMRSLMPALEREGLDAHRLALLARRLKRADAAIETQVDRALAALTRPGVAPGSLTLDAADYCTLSDEVSLRLLGRALVPVADGAIGLAKLEALKEALDAAQKAGMPRFRRSLAGAMVTLAGGKIMVEPAPPRRIKALTTPVANPRRGKAPSRKLRYNT